MVLLLLLLLQQCCLLLPWLLVVAVVAAVLSVVALVVGCCYGIKLALARSLSFYRLNRTRFVKNFYQNLLKVRFRVFVFFL